MLHVEISNQPRRPKSFPDWKCQLDQLLFDLTIFDTFTDMCRACCLLSLLGQKTSSSVVPRQRLRCRRIHLGSSHQGRLRCQRAEQPVPAQLPRTRPARVQSGLVQRRSLEAPPRATKASSARACPTPQVFKRSSRLFLS